MGTTAKSRISEWALVLLSGLLCVPLTGCIALGYSSGGGWFIWPGGLGLLLLIAIVLFILRQR
jgi:hypothetical protein